MLVSSPSSVIADDVVSEASASLQGTGAEVVLALNLLISPSPICGACVETSEQSGRSESSNDDDVISSVVSDDDDDDVISSVVSDDDDGCKVVITSSPLLNVSVPSLPELSSSISMAFSTSSMLLGLLSGPALISVSMVLSV